MIFVVCIFGRPNWKPNFEANPKIESWNFITHDHFPNPILIIRFFLRENGVARHLDYYCIDIKEKTVFSILFHLKQDSMRSSKSLLEFSRKYSHNTVSQFTQRSHVSQFIQVTQSKQRTKLTQVSHFKK